MQDHEVEHVTEGSHLDFFPENLGAIIDKRSESFHQDIGTMEKGYQSNWISQCWLTIVGYCSKMHWTLRRNKNQQQNIFGPDQLMQQVRNITQLNTL